MPRFEYEAKNKDGKVLTGALVVSSQNEARNTLRQKNLTPISIKEVSNDSFWDKLLHPEPIPRVKAQDIVIFTRQFATMIGAGIPIMECLSILQEQVNDKGFKFALAKIIEDVKSGADLSSALGKHPRVFKRIYCNMIKAGEASGQLDEILVRLAEYQEKAESLKREIKSAMTYPVISLALILGITIFLMVFIIPQFKSIFDAMKVPLPTPTVIVMAISNFMRSQALYILAGVTVIVVSVVMWKKTDSGGYQWDWIMLKLPIFGPLFQKVAIARFARTFSTLIQSGVPILGALEIVANTAGNRVIEEAVNNARDSIRQGEQLAKPLSSSSVFPPMVVRMISIGEKSGALEILLNKISDFYDEQISATVDALTSLIEPLMIGVMGFLVGGIVMAIFLPIFEMQKAMGK